MDRCLTWEKQQAGREQRRSTSTHTQTHAHTLTHTSLLVSAAEGECVWTFNCSTMADPGQEGEGQMQRLEVSKEDLTQATNKLGLTGPPKSKTIQVMEECEKRGTAAPSVFGSRKSGPETTGNTRPARPVRK